TNYEKSRGHFQKILLEDFENKSIGFDRKWLNVFIKYSYNAISFGSLVVTTIGSSKKGHTK
ncbi:hypothetical protein, partial [Bacillus cereus]|uniref:hypothetical protein n=1 Tax=Bacillus cereus TaxID=1396 RepID=UPI001C54C267